MNVMFMYTSKYTSKVKKIDIFEAFNSLRGYLLSIRPKTNNKQMIKEKQAAQPGVRVTDLKSTGQRFKSHLFLGRHQLNSSIMFSNRLLVCFLTVGTFVPIMFICLFVSLNLSDMPDNQPLQLQLSAMITITIQCLMYFIKHFQDFQNHLHSVPRKLRI